MKPGSAAMPTAPQTAAGPGRPREFRAALPAVLGCAGIFFLGFMARIILGPLMVVVEADLRIGHAASGGLMLFLSVGLALALFLAGSLSAAIPHRTLIGVSVLAQGAGLLLAAAVDGLWGLRGALFLVGFGGGLYLPSGVATVTSLTRRQDWGRTMAVHELAPNAAFVAAPLLAEAMLALGSWRAGLGVFGAVHLAAGACFLARFGHGRSHGHPPGPEMLKAIVAQPAFWGFTACFALAVGASVAPFAMLPLHLVEQGYDREAANTLLAVSRLAGLAMVFASGWLSDRLGPDVMIKASMAACGLATAALALPRPMLPAAVLAQAAASVCFFPAAFAALSGLFPAGMRPAAISLMSPVAALGGSGLVTAALGFLGQHGSFRLGFGLLGLCVLVSPLTLGGLGGSHEAQGQETRSAP